MDPGEFAVGQCLTAFEIFAGPAAGDHRPDEIVLEEDQVSDNGRDVQPDQAEQDIEADLMDLRSLTPGPYTFILPATRELPKRLQNPKRRTIGLRVPDHAVVHAMLKSLGEPIMSSTLSLPGDEMPLTDPQDIEDRVGHEVDVIVDSGPVGVEPTTVLDLSHGSVEILRVGRGPVDALR